MRTPTSKLEQIDPAAQTNVSKTHLGVFRRPGTNHLLFLDIFKTKCTILFSRSRRKRTLSPAVKRTSFRFDAKFIHSHECPIGYRAFLRWNQWAMNVLKFRQLPQDYTASNVLSGKCWKLEINQLGTSGESGTVWQHARICHLESCAKPLSEES